MKNFACGKSEPRKNGGTLGGHILWHECCYTLFRSIYGTRIVFRTHVPACLLPAARLTSGVVICVLLQLYQDVHGAILIWGTWIHRRRAHVSKFYATKFAAEWPST